MEDFIKHLHEEYPHTHLDLIEKEFEEFDKKGRGISKSFKNYNTDFENPSKSLILQHYERAKRATFIS